MINQANFTFGTLTNEAITTATNVKYVNIQPQSLTYQSNSKPAM